MFNILRWSLVPVFLFFATPSQAITLNPKNIGSFMFGLSGAGTNLTAVQALSGFRSAFSPFSIGMTLGAYAILRATDYALNKYNFLPGQNNPNLPAVPGWSNPNTPPTQYPAFVRYGGVSFSNPPLAYSDTKLDFCQGIHASWHHSVYQPPWTNFRVSSNGLSCAATDPQGNGWLTCDGCLGPRYYCNTGDTLSGTNCIYGKQQSTQWPSDGTPTLVQNSNHEWVNHPRDPDIATDVNGTSYTRTGTDQWGNPVRETFRNNPNGGMTYLRDSQTTGSNSAPAIYRDRLEFDSSGNLVDTSTGEFPNVYIDANPEERTPGQEDNTSNPGGTTPPPPADSQTDCDKYPNAIGCAQFGTPQNGSPLTEKDLTTPFVPTPLPGANACPAPLTAYFFGVPLTISYQMVCDFASGIKAIVLMISTLIAMYIILGYSTGGRS